jgi:hypothetical protein
VASDFECDFFCIIQVHYALQKFSQ